MRFSLGIFFKLVMEALLLLRVVAGQNLTSEQQFNAKRTVSFGVVSTLPS